MRTAKNIIIMADLNGIERIQEDTVTCVYEDIVGIRGILGSVRLSILYTTSNGEIYSWIFDVNSSRKAKLHAIILSAMGVTPENWIEDYYKYTEFKRIRLFADEMQPIVRFTDIAAILEIKHKKQILQCKSITEEQEIKKILSNHKGWRKRLFCADLGSEE